MIKSLTLVLLAVTFGSATVATRKPDLEPGTIDARVAIGSGSTCRVGCNDSPLSQCVNYYIPIDPPHVQIFLYSQRTTRNPHLECGWAWGQDTCVPLEDIWCIKIETMGYEDCVGTDNNPDITTTSTCELPGSGG
ncbi:MAG: hypothetical protein CNCCGFBP_00069 [Fimbriimonadaceae bacterium]|nr:hypothetical protein [Fimbriimonadaceae bacterium]